MRQSRTNSQIAKPAAPVDVRSGLERARELYDVRRARHTITAYAGDVDSWQTYAGQVGIDVFPATPEALCAWIGSMDLDGLAMTTIERRVIGVGVWHQDRGIEPPPTKAKVVREVLRGLRRGGNRGRGQAKPLTSSILKKAFETGKLSLRDRALLLVGWTLGLRRSELIALRKEDLRERPEGFLVTISQSKTDQEGKGQTLFLPYGPNSKLCPVIALKEWTTGTSKDLIFPFCDKTVARIVQKAVRLAGIDSKGYSGHSLRAGMATEAATSGISLPVLMRHSRHRSVDIAASYYRDEDAMSNNTAKAILENLK